MFIPAELILKKRRGEAHTRDELKFWIQSYAEGKIPDYQMSAWLMAVCFKGMDQEEIYLFTDEMKNSGRVLDFSDLGYAVDKHSTGGLGDKTSLILAPLVAAGGLACPMIAGRGLGHTGGTLDKLESLPGFSVQLDLERFQKQVRTLKMAIIGQTAEICPADKKLYALRDVTGTVDSLPLICGSIMSKKLAEGITGLVLDVKYGSGAFMKTQSDAELLAQALVDIGKRAGKKVTALVTRMTEPLGRFIGNALEVQECIDILRGKTGVDHGKGYADTIELTLVLAGHMFALGGRAKDPDDGFKLAQDLLTSGAALKKFEELVKAQGGTIPDKFRQAPVRVDVLADHNGVMHFKNLEKLGLAGIALGAGRQKQTDKIDFAAGIEVLVKDAQPVHAGQPLLRLYAESELFIQNSLPLVKASFNVVTAAVTPPPLIAKVIT
jgi:pyrimidine-nucleoside phosphorylase